MYINKLQEIVNNLENHLEDIILRKTTNIYNTRSSLINVSYKFKAILKDLNEQTLFFITHIANMQQPDLYKCMPNIVQYATISEIEYSKLVQYLV